MRYGFLAALFSLPFFRDLTSDAIQGRKPAVDIMYILIGAYFFVILCFTTYRDINGKKHTHSKPSDEGNGTTGNGQGNTLPVQQQETPEKAA